VHENPERERTAGGALAHEEGEQGTEGRFHARSLCQLAAPNPLRGGVGNDEEFIRRFLQHTQALLAHGTAPRATAG
jgi:hypothetical protein